VVPALAEEAPTVSEPHAAAESATNESAAPIEIDDADPNLIPIGQHNPCRRKSAPFRRIV